MEFHRVGLLALVQVLYWASWSHSAPIEFTFEGCIPGHIVNTIYYCCPPLPTKPIIDWKPPALDRSKPPRIRKALQCLSEEELAEYLPKLFKAYELIRALPHDDTRSMYQQGVTHCAYGTGALVIAGKDMDVHLSWLFNSFHRMFTYFHERILQKLLGDPDFTLHFWNWDNDGSGDGSNGCSRPGNLFPPVYADPSLPLFHVNRTVRANIPGLINDLGIGEVEGMHPPTYPNDFTKARNTRVTRQMMQETKTAMDFFGRAYRYGDERVHHVSDGAGTMEGTIHFSIHYWVGGSLIDLLQAAQDPVFFAHHGNTCRLWDLWNRMHPDAEPITDPDFLEASYLFWDENGDLNRVKVKDSLDIHALGYDYEKVDNPWNTDGSTDASFASSF